MVWPREAERGVSKQLVDNGWHAPGSLMFPPVPHAYPLVERSGERLPPDPLADKSIKGGGAR